MVAEPRIWVDIEGAVRAWARQMVHAVDGRVFLSFDGTKKMPQIALFRISGPDDACVIQFDVWSQNRAQAVEVAVELETAVDAISHYSGGGVLLKDAVIEDVRWQPDERSGTPRYIVQATFCAMSASPS